MLLRSSEGGRIRHEPFWGTVLPLADGTRTADQIADELEQAVPLTNTYYALMCMEREAILTEGPGAEAGELRVEGAVVVRDYLDPKLEGLACPFIPVRVSGDSIWAGPVVASRAIWDALVARLRNNLYAAAKRVWFPPSEEALQVAADWVRRMDRDRPALWTGTVSGGPRKHAFLPGGGSVRERLEESVSPIAGLVPVIERLTGNPVAVYQATQFHPVIATAGKGMDDTSARLSCIAEVAERQSMLWRGCERVRRGRFAEMEGAVRPAALTHWSPRQFVASDEEIDWVEARVVGNREARRFIPAAYCFHGHPDGRAIGAEGDSNGCAAGETIEGAVRHGFLELVERDAFAIWWYNRIPRRAFPRDLVDSAPAAARLREAGYSLTVLDVTSDLGVPVAVALTTGSDGVPRDIGFGAAWDAREAIHRAALEAGQLIATPQPRVWAWLRAAWEMDAGFLCPGESSYGRGSHAVAWTSGGSMEEVICAADLEVMFVDLTRADIGIPVVRVVSPTLRPPWPRFGAGRLYEVPVRCGWLARARSEDEMNPIPFIL